jgi:hypothetical protein
MVEIEKSSDASINDKNDVTTAPTIATIWAAKWFKFFALNGNATVATFSSSGIERYAIDECCHL